MKFIALVLVFLAAEARAFDPGGWLARRERFTREAARLRAAYAKAEAEVTDAAEDVNVPVETHPDGSVKTSISARRAQVFLKEDVVWAEGVVIRQMDEAGRETMRIEAEKLLFSRAGKCGWAEGPARMTRGKTAFSGTDVFFSTDEEYMLSSEASSLVSKDLKFGGAP